MTRDLPKAVEALNLSLSLGGREILRDVSCSVARGQFFCVIGPNGAGKSTFLKCAGGLVNGWRGSVRICGDELLSLSRREAARRVAWVHQGSPATLFYTVRQFASLSRFARRPLFGKSSEDDAAVASALKVAGVGEFADRPLSTLSGGERQRAFIAAALAQETEILFLDEPTSFLDYGRQGETLALAARLNKEAGKTIVMVTHDVNHAAFAADEILAIKDGRSVWQGPPEELFSGSLLRTIFGEDFELFSRGGGLPYAVPKGILK